MNSINRVNLIQMLVSQSDKRAKHNPTHSRFNQSAQSVTVQLGQLDPIDPDTPARALAMLIRAILISQFGEAIVNEPAFVPIINDVMSSLKSHPKYDNLLQFARQQCMQVQQQNK